MVPRPRIRVGFIPGGSTDSVSGLGHRGGNADNGGGNAGNAGGNADYPDA